MGVRLFPRTCAVCLVLVLASANIFHLAQGNCRDFDFENGKRTLSKWRKTGHAFDDQPTYGDNAHVRNPDITTNVQGDWWIGTFENRSSPNEEGGYLKGDFPIGTLTSPKFRITGPKMSFLLGGGCDPGRIRVELLINGEVAREATVDNCLDHMRRREWDVSAFKNKIAQIRLVDGSRKGHINFDDLWGDFTCIGDNDDLIVVDEPLVSANGNKSGDKSLVGSINDGFSEVNEPLFVNRTESDGKSHDDPITGTDDEYNNAVQNSSKPQAPLQNKTMSTGNAENENHDVTQNALNPNLQSQDRTMEKGTEDDDNSKLHISPKPYSLLGNRLNKMLNGQRQHDALLGGTKISSSNINTRPRGPRLRKPLFVAKIANSPNKKLADNSSNISAPIDDDIRNLTCKAFLVEIKTGQPWDNDFLFSSNENYQATRREIEVKVLAAYEDDKDFRGAYFSKFSSSEDPEGVKAFFVLRFRAVGKFLGKLIDKLGNGIVSAAGCYKPIQCPSPCPQTCWPSCQTSCCQPSVSVPVAAQPVYQPAAANAPVAQCPSPCPQSCAPACHSACCQQSVPAPVAPQPAVYQPVAVSTPVAQCPSPCPQKCAPSCQSSCCQPSVPAPVAPQAALYQPVAVSNPAAQCPSPCPQKCAPSCQLSCCQQSVPAPVAPQPAVYQPVAVSAPAAQCPSPCPQKCAPSCQSSCCKQPAPAPVAQCPSPCPQKCAPSCHYSCCQQSFAAPQPVYQPPVPMAPPLQITVSTPQVVLEQPAQQWNTQPPAQVSQPVGLSNSQCSAGCSPNCAPSCSPTCCQFFDSSKRNGEVKKFLRKESLEEEKD